MHALHDSKKTTHFVQTSNLQCSQVTKKWVALYIIKLYTALINLNNSQTHCKTLRGPKIQWRSRLAHLLGFREPLAQCACPFHGLQFQSRLRPRRWICDILSTKINCKAKRDASLPVQAPRQHLWIKNKQMLRPFQGLHLQSRVPPLRAMKINLRHPVSVHNKTSTCRKVFRKICAAQTAHTWAVPATAAPCLANDYFDECCWRLTFGTTICMVIRITTFPCSFRQRASWAVSTCLV